MIDYQTAAIAISGIITSGYTVIRIFGGSNIKRDIQDLTKSVDKIDKKLFGNGDGDGLITEVRLLQDRITINKSIAAKAHTRLDQHFGRDQN